MQSALEQFNYLSLAYYKIPLINQFEYGTGTSVSIEFKKDWIKSLDIGVPRSVEISIILKPQEDIRLLQNLYTFENPTDIRRFLFTHQNLIEILFEAHKQIKKIFGEVVNLSLEINYDPEEDFEGLFVIIETNLSPEGALDLLDRFDEEWWLDVDFETRCIMGVTVRII